MRRLSYIPTVHSTIKFIVKAAPSPTFPFTKHLGYTLQSSWPLDASGSRFGSKVLETQLDMDRLSLDTYPPAHKTTSSAGATTTPGELSPILRGQRHVTPPEQQENTASRVPQHGHTGIHLFSTCPILTAPKEAFMFSEDSFYQIIFLVNGRNLLLLAWLVILLLLNIECFEYVATLEVRVSFLCLL